MSELHHTLFVVSCLAALGLGLSAGLAFVYYTQWKPLIAALTSRCEELEAEVRVERYKKVDARREARATRKATV